jgi:hypothetical protein
MPANEKGSTPPNPEQRKAYDRLRAAFHAATPEERAEVVRVLSAVAKLPGDLMGPALDGFASAAAAR